jgi:branched-chain amino acid transport system ATP-binding protein
MSEPLLSVAGLEVSYGPIKGVKDVSCELRRGELVAIIGANGAGKTSFLRAVSGLVPASKGTVELAGEQIGRLRADERVRKGLAHVPEGRKLFGPLSVEENLRLGTFASRREHDQARLEATLARVYELFPVLAERRRQKVATLSGGEQQMVAVGRALMSQPSVLLLDEPSLGLAPKMVEAIFGALTTLNAEGLSVICVEQNATLALECSTRCYLFELGRVALSGDSADLAGDEQLAAVYLGGGVRT